MTSAKRNIYILLASFLGMTMIGVAYYLKVYESPQDCFVREIRAWAINNNIEDSKMKWVSRENSEKTVAKAKTILKEYSIKNVSGDNEKIFIQMGTLIDYCNVD